MLRITQREVHLISQEHTCLHYCYVQLAKQPGSDYRIRLREMERNRIEKSRIQNEEDFKNLIRNAQHKKLIEVADRKCLYNQIKRMVECGMKANEHLFMEKRSEPEPVKEIEEISINPVENMKAKTEILKKQKEEEEKKIVEEKRLQMFIENSEDLRSAAIAKRQREISDINYKIILEREKLKKEQKIKQKEINNAKHLENICQKAAEEQELRRKNFEKKLNLKKLLTEQVEQKAYQQKKEKEMKKVEQEELKKIMNELLEKEENEKIERIKKHKKRVEEIKQFTETRSNLLLKKNHASEIFDETFALTMRQNIQNDTIDKMEAKVKIKHENELFMNQQNAIKEERKRQNEEISRIVSNQMKEIEKMKHLAQQELDTSRKKRIEESYRILQEQIEYQKKRLEQENNIKRQLYEKSIKDHEDYLKNEKKQLENKIKSKFQFRNELTNQIEFRKNIIEEQRKLDLENHKKYLAEIEKQEELLQSLLKKLQLKH
ncbi:trichohyalin-like isoform X2 [Daktulosphaira vitifoliae]|uniref:trichohyalin-like isoform X2 n=1 Tax=Daktulosphaira vitifoliae TaxID=58002 RepID=UPI0021A9BEF8|nr:trichohyalin-like isoform X2 [Daktulosphaira vitifoliae]